MLKVYCCALPEEELAVSETILSDYRRNKLASQRNALVRKRSVLAELLLRHALKEQGSAVSGPLAIRTGEFGKPSLADHSFCFSLSDSGRFVLCALSDQTIGADIQRITPPDSALMERFYTDAERAYVQSSADRDTAFTEIWAKKESYCKAIGKGLAIPLASFSVIEEKCGEKILCKRTEGYVVSICILDGEPPASLEIEQVEIGALL